MDESVVLKFLLPYQFSPLITAGTALILVLYLRGLAVARGRGRSFGPGRPIAFLSGLALCYLVLHTGFDYYAQYVFFMHRLQHLVLHHLGPFLIALGVPWPILALGTPARFRGRWLPAILCSRLVRYPYRLVQNPVVASVLFVGLIYFWLTPEIHFDAMLNLTLYHVMNGSMLIDGLLFWWLMLNPDQSGTSTTMKYPGRILVLFAVMVPQIVLGAYITLSKKEIYDVYDVCGRAWPIDPATDQILGGLITWIPAAMMSVAGTLVILSHMKRRDSCRQSHAL